LGSDSLQPSEHLWRKEQANCAGALLLCIVENSHPICIAQTRRKTRHESQSFFNVWNFAGGELLRSQTADSSPSRTSSEYASFRPGKQPSSGEQGTAMANSLSKKLMIPQGLKNLVALLTLAM
jgi:hypothetical protein